MQICVENKWTLLERKLVYTMAKLEAPFPVRIFSAKTAHMGSNCHKSGHKMMNIFEMKLPVG